MPDDFVRRALEPYGKVVEVARDKVLAEFFAGIETKTRLFRMTLNAGMTKESLPHQLKMSGAKVPVLVPGRAPLRLRCKKTVQIRKDCRVPCCLKCNRYGHEASDCVHKYASVTNAEVLEEVSDRIMEAEEAEASYGTDSSGTSADPLPLTAAGTAEQSPVASNKEKHDRTITECPVSGVLTQGTLEA